MSHTNLYLIYLRIIVDFYTRRRYGGLSKGGYYRRRRPTYSAHGRGTDGQSQVWSKASVSKRPCCPGGNPRDSPCAPYLCRHVSMPNKCHTLYTRLDRCECDTWYQICHELYRSYYIYAPYHLEHLCITYTLTSIIHTIRHLYSKYCIYSGYRIPIIEIMHETQGYCTWSFVHHTISCHRIYYSDQAYQCNDLYFVVYYQVHVFMVCFLIPFQSRPGLRNETTTISHATLGCQAPERSILRISKHTSPGKDTGQDKTKWTTWPSTHYLCDIYRSYTVYIPMSIISASYDIMELCAHIPLIGAWAIRSIYRDSCSNVCECIIWYIICLYVVGSWETVRFQYRAKSIQNLHEEYK